MIIINIVIVFNFLVKRIISHLYKVPIYNNIMNVYNLLNLEENI